MILFESQQRNWCVDVNFLKGTFHLVNITLMTLCLKFGTILKYLNYNPINSGKFEYINSHLFPSNLKIHAFAVGRIFTILKDN